MPLESSSHRSSESQTEDLRSNTGYFCGGETHSHTLKPPRDLPLELSSQRPPPDVLQWPPDEVSEHDNV